MVPKCDLHIHTKHLGCANTSMGIPEIAGECERLGVDFIGITDHLNSLETLEQHRTIAREIEQLDTKAAVYFGVELNFTGADEAFPFSGEIREQYGFQFAIGGIHTTYLRDYDLQKIIDVQHRHHLRTCEDPQVDVLVHPYWFGKSEFDSKGWPWFDSVSVVPESYVRELGRVAKETNTAIEINVCANLVHRHNPESYLPEYAEFLAVLAEEGPRFSLGSDAHQLAALSKISAAWQMAERLGLSEERIWMPDCPPFAGQL